jgi:hypothetical protein
MCRGPTDNGLNGSKRWNGLDSNRRCDPSMAMNGEETL